MLLENKFNFKKSNHTEKKIPQEIISWNLIESCYIWSKRNNHNNNIETSSKEGKNSGEKGNLI